MSCILTILVFSLSTLIKAQDPLGNNISGDQQVGIVESKLQKQILVRVVDEQGDPETGVEVRFRVLEEPRENIVRKTYATLSQENVKTDHDGYAMSELTLGATEGNYYVLVQTRGQSLIFNEIALEQNWLMFLIFTLFGGLGVFIFGLNYGSKGLIRIAGAKMRDLLFNLTKNRFTAVLTGIFVTVILGSSTASSILLVKFASSGLVLLSQALGVLMGINIGTTITVQIIAFKLLNYGIFVVGFGFFLMHLFPRFRNIGQAIFGLGLLFFSLRLMSMATANLRYVPAFDAALAGLASYPVLGIIIAALIAFVLRSSAATIGIVLMLAFDSLITFPQAIPLIMGANLGTTFSGLLAADTVEGRRVAFGHLFFNLVVIIILVPFMGFVPNLMSLVGGDIARQIANFHTFFNILVALIFLPLIDPLTRTLQSLVKETKQELMSVHRLDPVFLSTPAIALGQATREILYMADITLKMLEDSIKVFRNRDNELRRQIVQTDDRVDSARESITPYLTKITEGEMDTGLSKLHSALLNAVNEIEHVGDVISKNLMIYAKKQISSGFAFSKEGFAQLEKLHEFALTTLRLSIDALATKDRNLASEAAARKKLGYDMAKELNERHLDRLHRGLKESLETSTIHLDIISDLQRINFHAAEVGEALL